MSMNTERAERARAIIASYRGLVGEDDETAMCDLLADIMHYARGMTESGFRTSFRQALIRAKIHFRGETTEGMSKCDNCDKAWPENDLHTPEHLWERLDPGSEVPAGECPECGALCYFID